MSDLMIFEKNNDEIIQKYEISSLFVVFLQKFRNNLTEYYQVAFTANDEKTLNRELSSLKSIRNSFPKYLLTLDYDNTNIDGIQRINVIDWLLQES